MFCSFINSETQAHFATLHTAGFDTRIWKFTKEKEKTVVVGDDSIVIILFSRGIQAALVVVIVGSR